MKRLTLTLAITALFAFGFTSCEEADVNPDTSKTPTMYSGSSDDTSGGKGD